HLAPRRAAPDGERRAGGPAAGDEERVKLLLRLYPKPWRQRYGEEFEALLAEVRPTPRIVLDLVFTAWDAHWHLRMVDRQDLLAEGLAPDADLSQALAGGVIVGLVLTGVALPIGVVTGALSVPAAIAAVLGGLAL